MEYQRDYRKGPPADWALEPPDSLVREAQELLVESGYDIGKAGVTGILNDGTLDAVETFRIHHSLPVKRSLDADFLDALQREDTAAPENEQPIDQSDPRIAALEKENRAIRETLVEKGVVTEADLNRKRQK